MILKRRLTPRLVLDSLLFLAFVVFSLVFSLSMFMSELSYDQSKDRPPSQATVTVFKKHLVSKVPHLKKDREGSRVGQV